MGKARKITNEELADLPETWENPRVDTRKYIQCTMSAYEVDQELYETLKHAGALVQIHNGRYYAGY